jgi:hypothetical protein
MKKYSTIDEQIRSEMGRQIVKDAKLPVRIIGDVHYNGDLTINSYRQIFPTGDNFTTVYLTLKSLDVQESELIILIMQKFRAVRSSDFKAAARYRDEILEYYDTRLKNTITPEA